MERDRGGRAIAIVAICIAVLGLSVAYASLSQQLNIVGNATVKGDSWKVHFNNLASVTPTGYAAGTTANVTLSDTDVTVTGVTLTAPGDKIDIVFDIVNDGSIDAKIGTLTTSTPTFTGTTGDTKTTDETAAEGAFQYSLKYYSDGVAGAAVAANDTLDAGETKTVILTLTLDSTTTTVPSKDVAVNGFGTTIVYVQK